MAKIKVKIEDWLEYLESQVNVTLYVWGANDELCVNLLHKLVEMERADHSDSEAFKNLDRTLTLLQKRLLVGCDMLKIHCADCSGLAVGFLLRNGVIKSDKSADGLYNLIEKKITLGKVKAGDYLFKGSENHKTHVGYAVDDKYAIESKNHDVDVVKTKISEGGWRFACRPDWYAGIEPDPDKPVLKRELYLADPMMRGEDVKELQERLNERNYNCGTADGVFGKKTDISVRNFQSDHALKVDGIVGKNTAEMLGFKWEG